MNIRQPEVPPMPKTIEHIRPIKPCPYLLPCGICDRKELQTDDPITMRMCSQYLPEGRTT